MDHGYSVSLSLGIHQVIENGNVWEMKLCHQEGKKLFSLANKNKNQNFFFVRTRTNYISFYSYYYYYISNRIDFMLICECVNKCDDDHI